MRQYLFIIVDIAGEHRDILPGLPFGKTGDRDPLYLISEKQADLPADRRPSDLRPGVAKAVDHDAEEKDHCDKSRNFKCPGKIKCSAPQKSHDCIKQQEQAAGKQSFDHSSRDPDIKISVFFKHILICHPGLLLFADK